MPLSTALNGIFSAHMIKKLLTHSMTQHNFNLIKQNHQALLMPVQQFLNPGQL